MVTGDSSIAYCTGNDPSIAVLDVKQEAFVKKITSSDLDKTKIM